MIYEKKGKYVNKKIKNNVPFDGRPNQKPTESSVNEKIRNNILFNGRAKRK